jgi:Ni/Co efflux regulator RcnB
MKRFILAATAIVALGAPMAAPAFADPPRSHRDHDRRDYRGPDRVVVNKHTHWHVGDRIDRHDRRYREVDYRAHRLREPPRGYHYVRDDNTGDIVLAVIATGLIASLIFN